jgi:predicted transcriptional regulator
MIKIDVDKIRTRTIQKIEENDGNLNDTARKIGIVQPVLYRFVRGETVPNIENLNKIFDYIYK